VATVIPRTVSLLRSSADNISWASCSLHQADASAACNLGFFSSCSSVSIGMTSSESKSEAGGYLAVDVS